MATTSIPQETFPEVRALKIILVRLSSQTTTSPFDKQLTPFSQVIGVPSSGKSTLCTLLSKEHPNYFHLSAGSHLRSIVQKGPDSSDTVKLIKPYLEKEELIPAEDMVTILHSKTIEERVNNKHIIVTGFPRDVESAKEFEKKVCLASSL